MTFNCVNRTTGQSHRMSTGGKRRRCSSPLSNPPPPYIETVPSATLRILGTGTTDTPSPEHIRRDSASASSLSTVADVISAPNPLMRDTSTFQPASIEAQSHPTVARIDDRVCLSCVRLWADRGELNPPHQACQFPDGATLSASK
jgi:hypothetical protein